jgi:acyl-CoA thioester hydrolase
MPIRVRYVECDAMGFAHHSAYLPWLEMGRTELLRQVGVTYAQLEAAGVLLVVTQMELKYRRPARYDDVLSLTTRVTRATRVKIEHAYELRVSERGGGQPHALTAEDIALMQDTGEDLLFTGASTIACIGRDGRPAPLPEWLAGRA